MKFDKNEFENYIKAKNIDYELIEHDILIRSARDGAEYFNIDIGQTAATLILVVDGKLHGLIVSGKTGKLDMDKVAHILGAEKVKMAPKEKIENDLNMYVGCVPMVNLPIPCLIDEELLNYDYVYGGTGDKNFTLKLKPEALTSLNEKTFIYKLK